MTDYDHTATFREWLGDQAHRDDAIGDFARTVITDPDFPSTVDRNLVEYYITANMGGTFDPVVHSTFAAAFYEYDGDYDTSRHILKDLRR